MSETSLSLFTQYGQWLYLIFGPKVDKINKNTIFLNIPTQTCNSQTKLLVAKNVSSVKEQHNYNSLEQTFTV